MGNAWRRFLPWLASAGALLALVVGVSYLSPRRSEPATPVEALVASVTAPPTPAIVEAHGDSIGPLGALMSSQTAFADDVVFLVVSSVRSRCEPTHAHELSAMAVRAQLPVLAGVSAALGKDTDRRTALLGAIRDIAARAPCRGRFTMAVGAFRMAVDVAAYANAFPDSYFDPTIDTVPEGFGGTTLAERAGDDCRRVAYAVLPLDQPTAWQCTALRAGARQRIVSLCHAGGDGGADDAASRIRGVADGLPPTCR